MARPSTSRRAEAVCKLGDKGRDERGFGLRVGSSSDRAQIWLWTRLGARKEALKHAELSIEARAGPIYPGIAAISPLIPTKATMRLML